MPYRKFELKEEDTNMWAILLRIALGILGELAVDFLKQLIEDKMNDPELVKDINDIVRAIETRPRGLRGEAKARVARSNIRMKQPVKTKGMKDATLNSMIEMSVQKLTREAKANPIIPLVVL